MASIRKAGWFLALALVMAGWMGVLGSLRGVAEAGVVASHGAGAGELRAAEGAKGPAFLVGAAFFFLGGCGGTQAIRETDETSAAPVVIQGVPFLPQEEETCGPSSLAMVLRFLRCDV